MERVGERQPRPRETEKSAFGPERLSEVHPELASLAYENFLKHIAYNGYTKAEAMNALLEELNGYANGRKPASNNLPHFVEHAVDYLRDALSKGAGYAPEPERAAFILENGMEQGEVIWDLHQADSRFYKAIAAVQECRQDPAFIAMSFKEKSKFNNQYLTILDEISESQTGGENIEQRTSVLNRNVLQMKKLLEQMKTAMHS